MYGFRDGASCANCGKEVQKHFTAIGFLLFIATFWFFCVGLWLLFLMREDFCVSCQSDWWASYAKEIRKNKLFVYDPRKAKIDSKSTQKRLKIERNDE
ncbi:unnamed protein product, partial [Mesorhabditis belari]|uniref:LITAF domain-containing protein n=1 Tax=Mesorhabditis belari TaxID=2138241 RepID=A0AAF3J3M2_9BILA